MTARIVASNLRRLDKNTLLGSVDLEVLGWRLMFKGCLWHSKNGKEWVNFAAKEYTDQNGVRKYQDIIAFTDRSVHERFQAAALEAIHELEAADE